MENWNPVEEHIEGMLCEKGLMNEKYDFKKDDLVRKLTPLGKKMCEDLLKEKKWQIEYLELAKKKFSKYPKEIQVELWKNLINQIRKGKK
jgi:hypothetical protein